MNDWRSPIRLVPGKLYRAESVFTARRWPKGVTKEILEGTNTVPRYAHATQTCKIQGGSLFMYVGFKWADEVYLDDVERLHQILLDDGLVWHTYGRQATTWFSKVSY